MVREITLTSLYSGFLLAVLGLIAFATGQPFVFPSLGPTAYILSQVHDAEFIVPRRVVLSHTFGVIAGQISYNLLGAGVTVTDTAPLFSLDVLFLSFSAVLSVVLTAAAMVATDSSHPPACATTLIVSLGLFSTPAQGLVIVVSVIALVVVHELILIFVKRTGLTPVVGE